MPIPTYDQMLRPILALAAKSDISHRSVTEPMAQLFGLTPEEREVRIPGGGNMLVGRCGWAMTFLTKTALIEKVARAQYRITSDGRRYLSEYPETITVRDLMKQPGWESAWGTGRAKRKSEDTEASVATEHETTAELVARGVGDLRTILSERLLKEILGRDPTFFEHLVLDVLTAMGYGSTD